MIAIDMKLPESCTECRFSQGSYMYCHAMPENFCGYVNYREEDGKPEWCPLKVQEPVEPKKVNRYIDFDGEGEAYIPETYDCGACGNELPWKANYCPVCGRKVKWE